MHLAQETGGGFFEVSRKQSIDQVYEVLEQELRSQYSLGFVSDESVRISELCKLQLTMKPKGLVVQARDKYWAQHYSTSPLCLEAELQLTLVICAGARARNPD
jgi:hypothetical protein